MLGLSFSLVVAMVVWCLLMCLSKQIKEVGPKEEFVVLVVSLPIIYSLFCFRKILLFRLRC